MRAATRERIIIMSGAKFHQLAREFSKDGAKMMVGCEAANSQSGPRTRDARPIGFRGPASPLQ